MCFSHEKADEVIKIFNKVDDVIFKGFSEEEIKMLSSMTDKVENNLWEAIKNEEQK